MGITKNVVCVNGIDGWEVVIEEVRFGVLGW